MKPEDIANKRYCELTKEETEFFINLLKQNNTSEEQKDIIFIALLFNHTIKEAIDKIK